MSPDSRFRWLWAAAASASTADGIVVIALPLIALRHTTDARLVAGTRIAATLPWLLVGLLAGVLVDRVDRRRLMIGITWARAVILGVAASLLAGTDAALPVVYVAALLLGTAGTAYDTAAQAMVPGAVAAEHLVRANGRLLATQVAMAEFAGNPIGAALVGVSAAGALSVPAGMYAAAGVLLLGTGGQRRERPEPAARRVRIVADIRAGLRAVGREPTLRRLAVFAGVSNLVESGFMAVLVLYAVGPASRLRMSELGYGILLAGVAVGAVLGATCAGPILSRVPGATVLSAASILLATSFLLPVVLPDPVVVAVGMALAAFAIAVANVLIVSLRQVVVPTGMLGRVTAGTRLLVFGTMPMGAALAGVAADVIGIGPLFAVLAAVALTLLAVTATLRLPQPEPVTAS